MVEFLCDDDKVEQSLHKLHQVVTASGGFVHDQLTINCNNGEFSVSIPNAVPAGAEIVVLPRACLLPVRQFELTLRSNRIVVKDHHHDLSNAQVVMMEVMIELYNLTNKIATHKRTSTVSLFYEDKKLLDLILESRSPEAIAFFGDSATLDMDELFLDSFIQARVLSLLANIGADAGESGRKIQKTKVLMPIIDFVDHHSMAAGYLTPVSAGDVQQTNTGAARIDKLGGVGVRKSCPIKGSDECFVNYGAYDSTDALLFYNYLDKTADFVRSVPLQINLPGGKGVIRVESMMGSRKQTKLPEHLKDLKFYIPPMWKAVEKNTVHLGYLLIPPGRAPHAMRRVLELAIGQLEADLSGEQMKAAVLFAEKCVITENLRYFNGLLDHMEAYEPTLAIGPIAANIRHIATLQLENINSYALFDQVP